MSTVNSSGVQFWNGSAWITLAKGAQGVVGPAGPAGASILPVKSLASRNLSVAGSPSPANIPLAQWVHLGNLSTRADEINSPVSVSGDAFGLTVAPAAYLVTAYIQFTNLATQANLLTIVRWRSDGSWEEIARKTMGAQEDSITVTAVFLHTNPGDRLLIQGWVNQASGAYNSRMTVVPIGPIDPAPRPSSNDDYTSAGVRVTTYTITPTANPIIANNNVVTGDWMYLIHQHFRETADITPTFVESGWTQVIAPQVGGTAAAGIQWGIWRKKRLAGETGYTVNLSTARFVRASIIAVKQPNDDMPATVFAAQRGALNPSVLTIPGAVPIKAGGMVIAVAMQNTAAVTFTPPPVVTGADSWYSVPNVGSTTFFSTAWRSYPAAQNTDPVVFTWTTADAGRMGGVALVF